MQKKMTAVRPLDRYALPTPKMTLLQMTWRAGVTPKIVAQLMMKYSIAALFSLMKRSSDYPPLVKLAGEAKSEAIRIGEEVQNLEFDSYCDLVTRELHDIKGNLSSLNTPGNPLFTADQQLQLDCFQGQFDSIPKQELYRLIADKFGLPAAQVEQRIVEGDWILPSVKSPTPKGNVSLTPPNCDPELRYVANVQDELTALLTRLKNYSTEITQLIALNSLLAPSSNIGTLLAVNVCLDFLVGLGVLSHAAHKHVPPRQAEQRLQVAFALTAVVAPWIAAGIEATLGLNYVSLPTYPSHEKAQQAASELFEYHTQTFQQANNTVTEKLGEFPQLQGYPTPEMVTPGNVVIEPNCPSNPCVTKKKIEEPNSHMKVMTFYRKSSVSPDLRPPLVVRGPAGGDVVYGVTEARLMEGSYVDYSLTINSTSAVVSVDLTRPARLVLSQLPPMPSENPNFVNTKPCVMKVQVGNFTSMVQKPNFDIQLIPNPDGTIKIMIDGVSQSSLPLPASLDKKVDVSLSLLNVMTPQYSSGNNVYDIFHNRDEGIYNLCVFDMTPDSGFLNKGPAVTDGILLPAAQQQQPCTMLKVDSKITPPILIEASNNTPSSQPSKLKQVYPNSNYDVIAAHSAVQASSALLCAALVYALPVVGPTVMALQLAHNVTGNASTGPMAMASRGIRSVWNWRNQQSVLPLVERAPQKTDKSSQELETVSMDSQGI
jgi:hypothetical protein